MDNFIGIYENVVSKELCEYIINFFDTQNKMGNTHRGVTGGGYDPKLKDCEDLNLGNPGKYVSDKDRHMWNDPEFRKNLFLYESTVEKYWWIYIKKYLIDIEPWTSWKNTEKFNKDFIDRDTRLHRNQPLMHRYDHKTGQGFHAMHYDYSPIREILSKRMLVSMLYLNDVHEGGETEFYHQKLMIKPTQGTLVIWPAYFTHLHKGHSPISNTKYIVNKWLMTDH
tara:strand:- start:477 stop:1148 length:672 start_codon:yes stop_codon:yes gene_type:complete